MAQSISMLSTFPPTHCGIATFAQSLTESLSRQGIGVRRVALDTDGDHGDGIGFTAVHHDSSDIPSTAHALNRADAVIVQHEFGIFDGDDGEEALALRSSSPNARRRVRSPLARCSPRTSGLPPGRLSCHRG